MKIACGTDIIEIARIKKTIENTDNAFIQRVYTQKEITYCESKKTQKMQHYAVRFAAKEAVFKAISELLQDKYDIGWKNIEITQDTNGKPEVQFVGIKLEEIESIAISLSHCKEYAVAMVTAILKI